ncbi:Cobalt-zinc-cadmium resistance protein CzcA [Nymphon striatum]|nr:Cobalt-zinc-cadmium resistance protein CzcA [Nymphon striatum]
MARGLSIKDVVLALEENNANIGAGFIEKSGEQYLIRVPGQVKGLADIGNIVVSANNEVPIHISDVADVLIGQEARGGAATENSHEVVLGTVFMLTGANSREVSAAVEKKLQAINQSLPDGIVAKTVYDRTILIDKAMTTVKKNLLEGRVIRALDFGIIIDGAVVIVENCMRRLAHAQVKNGRQLSRTERFAEVFEAAKEARKPLIYGQLIIMAVYLPIFALTGVEGKMFHPMAFTVVTALVGAMLFSVTFIPAAVALFITGKVDETEQYLIRVANVLTGQFTVWSCTIRHLR